MANLSTFAKVRALHDRTDSAGERAAAMVKMQTLARKAGMSVDQAMSILDTPKPKTQSQAAADAFNDFFNTPEMRARQAERERERVRQARCAELIEEYGDEDQAFEDSPREAALKAACEPLIVWDTRPQWSGHYTLAGWGELSGKAQMPASVRAAVSAGWLLPETVSAAWAEFDAAEKLDRDRAVFEPAYTPHRWVEARRYVLEDLLATLPARSLNDIRARLSWMEHLNGLEIAPDPAEERIRLATLRADIERMGAAVSRKAADAKPAEGTAPEPYPTRRTTAQKRADVAAMLGAGLTDREIARRAGVSPQTVGNIKRSMANRAAD